MPRRCRATKAGALATLALALVLLALPSGALAAKQPRPSYWGAWIGPQLTGEQPPWDMSAVTRFEQLMGKGLSVVEFSVPFADCAQQPCSFYEFPTEPMQTVRDYGAIPFLSWSSFASSGEGHESSFQLADILRGDYDAYIHRFATEAAAWGHPFFLRFNWEMNGDWFPWSEGVNGNRRGQFVKVWRRVHNIFAGAGAGNATWVWCPYASPQRRFHRALWRHYPGHAFVDWTCMDGYNWARNPVNPAPWMSFPKIFAKTYRKVVRIAPRKPMILAEFASAGPPRARAAWIRNMFKSLRTRFRRVRGLIWFDKVDRGVQWPLETSPLTVNAFAQGIRRGYRPNVYATIDGGQIGPPGPPQARKRRAYRR